MLQKVDHIAEESKIVKSTLMRVVNYIQSARDPEQPTIKLEAESPDCIVSQPVLIQ